VPETEVGSERHRFCPVCGTEAVTDGSFCGECGQSLIKTTESGDQPLPVQTEVPSGSSAPPPPQPSTVAVPPTQPAVASVPPPLQTPPTPPSGKKPLRRRPVFWIALGVVVLVIIAGISVAFSGSSSAAYDIGVHDGKVMATADMNVGLTDQVQIDCNYTNAMDSRPHNLPSDKDDWIRGCVDGYEHAFATAGAVTWTDNSDPSTGPESYVTPSQEAQRIIDNINSGNWDNSGNSGNSGTTGTPTSSVGNSGTTGNASSGNAPTPTVPPTIPPTTTTTFPPTTTTTISPQAAYQAGYQAGQATFTGQSPSQIQKYCTDLLTSYVSPISENPALAAQFMAGCVAGAS
jgi:hypothetical protein